ncbi:MAG: hypothetical protein IPK50_22120 [Fibrobacterota bacterium]|nr:MAG: hypothetical protein IPK50_22120 [Fibrobacterota bacterium]
MEPNSLLVPNKMKTGFPGGHEFRVANQPEAMEFPGILANLEGAQEGIHPGIVLMQRHPPVRNADATIPDRFLPARLDPPIPPTLDQPEGIGLNKTWNLEGFGREEQRGEGKNVHGGKNRTGWSIDQAPCGSGV